MDKLEEIKTEQVTEKRKKPEPVKVDLLTPMKEGKGVLNLADFKASVLGLFDDILQLEGDSLPDDVKGQLARLRARIEIELRNI